jgi:hypothetical protein
MCYGIPCSSTGLHVYDVHVHVHAHVHVHVHGSTHHARSTVEFGSLVLRPVRRVTN